MDIQITNHHACILVILRVYISIVHRNHDGNHHKVHLRRHHFDDMGLLGDCTAVWDTATNGDFGWWSNLRDTEIVIVTMIDDILEIGWR